MYLHIRCICITLKSLFFYSNPSGSNFNSSFKKNYVMKLLYLIQSSLYVIKLKINEI